MLGFFGELSHYGLREIRLTQTPAGATAAGRLFGRLYIPGTIVLYEQPVPPWYVNGTLAGAEAESLTGAGAVIERSDDGMRCIVHWAEQDLRDFMLLDVLMHEIGHHLAQQFRGKRQAQVMRTADHERWARLFASRCRQAYLEAERTDE